MRCAVIKSFIFFSNERFSVIQYKSMNYSNRFPKRYLSTIFFKVFVHRGMGYTYSRGCRKKKCLLCAADANLAF